MKLPLLSIDSESIGLSIDPLLALIGVVVVDLQLVKVSASRKFFGSPVFW